MRIHVVAPGGIGRAEDNADVPALCALVAQLAERHDVTAILLFQYPGACAYERLGARIINLGSLPFTPGRAGPWLRRVRLRRLLSGAPPPDVVHAFWIGAASNLALAHAAARRAPCVVSVAGGELIALEDIGYGGARTAEGREAAARAFADAHAVCVGCEESLARVPATCSRQLLAPLYPDTAAFQRGPGAVPQGPGHILTVSNINPVKDPETLLRAFAIAARRVPNAHLTWCGLDTLDGATQRLAASLGIGDRVTFTGLLRYEELPRHYHAAQVYVQASRHEGQGVAVCEAAAAGLAVVGSDTGILRDLAAAGGALAVPPRAPEALGEALVQLLEDTALRAGITGKATAWAAAHTARHTAQAIESLYASLLG